MVIPRYKIVNFAAYTVTVFLTILLLILFTATVSNDVGQYDIFHALIKRADNLQEAIISVRFEPGFTTLYFILSDVDSRVVFTLLGSICLMIKFYLFRKYLDSSMIAWLAYIIIFMPSHEVSQIRSALASTALIYVLLRDQPKKTYFLEGISAMLMHNVGLLVFTYQLFNKPIRALILVICASLFFKLSFSLLVQNIPLFHFYRPNPQGHAANIFGSLFVIQVLIGFLCLLNWRILTYNQKKGAYLLLIGVITFVILNDFPFVHRIREVSMLGILPLMFTQALKKTLPTLLIYLTFSYYFFFHVFILFDELFAYL